MKWWLVTFRLWRCFFFFFSINPDDIFEPQMIMSLNAWKAESSYSWPLAQQPPFFLWRFRSVYKVAHVKLHDHLLLSDILLYSWLSYFLYYKTWPFQCFLDNCHILIIFNQFGTNQMVFNSPPPHNIWQNLRGGAGKSWINYSIHWNYKQFYTKSCNVTQICVKLYKIDTLPLIPTWGGETRKILGVCGWWVARKWYCIGHVDIGLVYLSRIGELLSCPTHWYFVLPQDCWGNWHFNVIGLDPNWQCVCWIRLVDIGRGFCFICQIRPLYDFFG